MTKPWSPDFEVSVHDQDLVIRLNHLPEAREHLFEADLEDGEMLIRSATLFGRQDHCLHVPLPAGLNVSKVETSVHDGAFEVHLSVPTL